VLILLLRDHSEATVLLYIAEDMASAVCNHTSSYFAFDFKGIAFEPNIAMDGPDNL